MGQLDRGAPTSPCDFYVTGLSGSAFASGRNLATFRVAVPASGSVCGEILVTRSSIAAGATVTALRHMYMYHDSEVAMPDGDASFIRFEDGADTQTYNMNAIIEYAGSNSTTVGTETFIYTTANQGPWFRKTGTPATLSGWLKLNLAGTDKYIGLYSSVS